MIRLAFYNAEAGSRANGPDDYSIGNNTGLDPGAIALPAAKSDASTASLVGLKKKQKIKMKHEMFKKACAFRDEIQKIAFGTMGAGMGAGMGGISPGTGMPMRRGGVVNSNSKKGLGPKIRIVTSNKSKKMY